MFYQLILLNKVGVIGELVSCFDKIICSKGVLNLDDIYLERTKGYEKGESGWFIGSLDENDKEEELEVFYIYEIIKLRPSIMQILSLPSGYMAVFNKENLVAIVDDDDNDILKLNIQFEYANINVLLLKQFFIEKGVRFLLTL